VSRHDDDYEARMREDARRERDAIIQRNVELARERYEEEQRQRREAEEARERARVRREHEESLRAARELAEREGREFRWDQ